MDNTKITYDTIQEREQFTTYEEAEAWLSKLVTEATNDHYQLTAAGLGYMGGVWEAGLMASKIEEKSMH